ncbi:hypothetical protein [Massilia sp. SYSU DXS3249]
MPDESTPSLRSRFAGVLAFAFLMTSSATAAEEAFVPRDLQACAANKPADGYDTVCKQPLNAGERALAREKLKDRGFAYGVEDDALTVVMRAEAADLRYPAGPRVCCDIQAYLDKVEGDIYAGKFRWNRMAQAMLDLRFFGMEHRKDARAQINGSPQFAAVKEKIDKGLFLAHGVTVSTEKLAGPGAIGQRTVTVATGPFCRRSLAHCSIIYMPDGDSTRILVGNALMNGVDMRDFVVVGVHNAEVNANETRMEELLHPHGAARYPLFMQFVTGDVRRHVEGARKPLRRLSAGYSNGGVWATDALLAHPDVFDGAIVMSPGIPKLRNAARLPAHRVFIGAGFMENHFHASSRKIAAGLAARGAAVRELYIPSGHSMNTWINVWNAAIKDLDATAQ